MYVPISVLLEKKRPRKPSRPDKPAEPGEPKDRGTDDAVEKRHAAQAKRKKTLAKKQRAARKDALEKNKVDRKARQQKIRDKADPEKQTGLGSVPAQISHCMMAIHVKRGKTKKAAWNICRWAMTKYGYLKPPYVKDGRLPIKMTQKGVRRSFQHGSEKGPLNGGVPGNYKTKFKKFKKMFKSIEKDIEQK